MSYERRRASRRVEARSDSLTGSRESVANRPNSFMLPLVVGVPVAASVGLFIVCHYLSFRFDVGSPITHYVDPHLAIWISLLAVSGTTAIWVVAMLEQRTRDRSRSGPQGGPRPRDRTRPLDQRSVR